MAETRVPRKLCAGSGGASGPAARATCRSSPGAGDAGPAPRSWLACSTPHCRAAEQPHTRANASTTAGRQPGSSGSPPAPAVGRVGEHAAAVLCDNRVLPDAEVLRPLGPVAALAVLQANRDEASRVWVHFEGG